MEDTTCSLRTELPGAQPPPEGLLSQKRSKRSETGEGVSYALKAGFARGDLSPFLELGS